MTVGEAALSAFLQVVFDKILSPPVNKVLKLFGEGDLDKTLKQWKRQLNMIEALLDDAEQKQFCKNAVKKWVNDLQDLAYDMEDILDDFKIEAQRHELNNGEQGVDDNDAAEPGFLGSANNMVKKFSDGLSTRFNIINPDMKSRIDDITGRLQEIQSQTQYLGLITADTMQQYTLQTEALRSRRESTSVLDEPEVFGRDDKKKEIITQLRKDDPSYKNYVVIPIVGPGGIGKTTLAQCVYNDEQVKSHFDMKAWVCVSDVFDVKRITTSIINSATDDNVDFSNLNLAQEKLMKVLSGKRFFIVLDDIWSDDYNVWSQLQTPFRNGVKGSKIVMTTRNEKIARMMRTNHITIITLEGLSDNDCWCLFQQHANEDTDLAELRGDILRNCKGLPLAAKALGGLLKSTTEKRQRRKMLESNVWGEESSVLPVLRLSYLHLPSNLKRVFAYCSVLPKDFGFEEKEVVLLWMAQGFLPDNQSESMENIGHNYFLDLVSRSLFEQSPSAEGEFIMHDLVHDLAQWAAGDVCYVANTMDIQKDLERTRHVSLTWKDTTLGSKLKYPQLRTFHDSSYPENLDFVQRFRYVRTLRLASWEIEELPECIGELKHLHFLELILQNLKVLPISIGKLWNLQTLECHCANLQEVPNIRFLVNLRHLSIRKFMREMPQGIGNLTNLQSLDEFVLTAGGGSRISELKNLNHLHGTITIYGLENVIKVEDAQEAHLHEKKSLDELYLDWGICRDEVDDNTKRDVLEQLQPHTSIKKCELKGYMGLTFPGWLGFSSFTHMVDIRLVMCKKCECLPPLGQLPMLRTLWVEGMNGIKEVGSEFYGHCLTPFPALRSLHFKHMTSWKKWLVHSPVDYNGAFPCLEMLEIENCFLLQGDLPPLPLSLKKLKISECKEMSVSLPSLPLLEVLQITSCKVLSIIGDVIFCSKRVILQDISEINGLPGHFPNIREELSIVNCQTSPITIDQIPVVLKKLKIDDCSGVQYLEFEDASSLTPCLETFCVMNCDSIVSIGRIPLKLQSLKIESCEELRVVEFNEQPKGLSGNDEKTLRTEEGVGLSPKPSLELPLLTKLYVHDCPSLIALREGLLLPGLEILNFSDCRNLEWLPCELHNLTSLQQLTIKNCPKMNSSFPEGGCSTLPNLTKITIKSCHKFESLVGDYPSLTSLSLENCQLLRFFPEDSLPRSLTSLSIRETNIEKPIQEWGLHLLTSLQYLTLEDVGSSTDSVECISDIHFPTSLSWLKIKGFRNLKTISCSTLSNLTWLSIRETNIDKPIQEWGLHLLTSLVNLTLEDVGSSTDSLECISDLHLPTSLEIKGFRNLKTISCSTLSTLTQLSIRETNIDKPIQEWGLHLLTSLKYLKLWDVGSSTDSLECISDIHLPTSLSRFHIKGFQNLKTIICSTLSNLTSLSIRGTNIAKPIQEWGLHLLTSLEDLTLEDVGSSTDSVVCISNLHFPTSLSWLVIKGFRNLKTISCSTLPKLTCLSICETNIDKPIQEWGLHLLTSLKYLTLEDVGSSTDSVECISDIHLPTSLSYLKIKGFRNLKTISCSTLPKLTWLNDRRVKNGTYSLC